jgi:hypothetical protein
MNRKNIIIPVINFAIAAILVLISAMAFPVSAQDENPSQESTAASESAVQPEGATDSQQAEIAEGIEHGAYFWADIDPVAIQALLQFGIGKVSIRLGKPDVNSISTVTENGQNNLATFSWKDGGDFSSIQNLPPSLLYRLVVEIDSDFLRKYNGGNFIEWLVGEINNGFVEIPENIKSVEIYFPEISDSEKVASLMQGAGSFSADFDIELGFDGIQVSSLQGSWFQEVGANTGGFVVYFINSDFKGLAPKIADRSWIDYTIGGLESFGIPYTAVLPIYNKAILFPADNPDEPFEIPPFDLEEMNIFGTPRQLGAAGIEYTINEDLNIGGFIFSAGDKIRILESLKEYDLKQAIEQIPTTAPNLKEISLFRFPLVPGFDPSANQALTSAGWLAVSGEAPFDPTEAGKDELDQKQDKGSQVIMMVTLGLMMFLIMRMMSKGKPNAASGDSGGK